MLFFARLFVKITKLFSYWNFFCARPPSYSTSWSFISSKKYPFILQLCSFPGTTKTREEVPRFVTNTHLSHLSIPLGKDTHIGMSCAAIIHSEGIVPGCKSQKGESSHQINRNHRHESGKRERTRTAATTLHESEIWLLRIRGVK